MLFTGLVWCYDVYMQHNNMSYLSDISAENDSSFESQDSDVEISEEDQIFHKDIYLSVAKMNQSDNHLYISPRLIYPYYSVWLPPKLN